MRSNALTPEIYIANLPNERKPVISRLREVIGKNLPDGFKETMNYGMIGYVVPHTIYPDGYHCTPELPLPFMNLASQKNFIGIYHMGIYTDKRLLDWFVGEYPKHCKRKLDMGKSCIRLKYMDEIPYDLLGEMASKITVREWINTYENALKNNRRK
ncbi:MAG: DUF1801 domain-containing protein [Saonia sp.]